MIKPPVKSLWMGQDIEQLPRETLIEIIHHLSRQLDGARTAARSVIEIHQMARAARAK
jgi:hypothetical protein